MEYIFLYIEMFPLSAEIQMNKLVRTLVIPALLVVAQAALAANTPGPQPPPPVPPILYPGPGPQTGPVDPTPVEPPPSN